MAQRKSRVLAKFKKQAIREARRPKPVARRSATKWVYGFGDGRAEGKASMRNLLGGKGAGLAEMANLGLPVPPGFTITTEVCTYYYANKQQYPKELRGQVEKALAQIGRIAGKIFGDKENPLLVSVRSGARASMPGMMDTVLNLGLNDETVEALAKKSGDRRFAYDSYRRFITMYSDVVLGVGHEHFEELLDHHKERQGYSLDTDLTADDWAELVERYKKRLLEQRGEPFPQDPHEQLWGAIGAVFGSWMNQRANTYRRLHNIPESWGTAVNVQAMVFGNMGDTSATGVAFTRNPSTGEKKLYGEFLINAQGEDVVAGIRTPQEISEAARIEAGSDKPSMEATLPKAYGELKRIYNALERHYRDMQDLEFTVEQGRLWMLQTRSGKRTAKAALRIAVELANEGLITKNEAVLRVDPLALDQLLHPTIDPRAHRRVIATGLPASPGAASGEIVFSSDEAAQLKADGRKVILVRVETSPEDIHGMHAAEGILTTRGGMTSHAAVVARGMGKPCVSGAGSLRVDYAAGTHDRRRANVQKRRSHYRRRFDRPSIGRQGRHDRAAALRRVLHADRLGRQGAQARRARQCRHAGRRQGRSALRRRGHRALPHRTHVLRRRPHPGGARDDPCRRREVAPWCAGQAVADAARRFRRTVRDHAGQAGNHPPARSAAARIPAAWRQGNRRSRRRNGSRPEETCRRARRNSPNSIRCSASAAAASPSPIRKLPRCRRARFSRRRSRRPSAPANRSPRK